MLNALSPRLSLLVIAAVALATVGGAWTFQYFGYPPCELCLLQRWAYYSAIPLALLLAAVSGSRPALARGGLYLMAILWLASSVFGAWHAGIEWKWWVGPTSCTGTGGLTVGLPDLSKPVVMCDQPAIRIFGLSLAGWNGVISLALALFALSRARAQGSSSVSQ
jgi:disulfide bond formation protein DsbB